MKPFSKKRSAYKKKVREYARLLKEDEDWDWAYIIGLLQYKLKRTRLCITSNNIVVSSKKIAKQIEQVEDLFGAVLDDKYYEKIGKDFRKKYGTGRFVFGKKDPDSKSIPATVKFRGETVSNRKRIHREFRRLHNQADKALERDLKKAFTLMNKNIRGWWD